MSETVSGLYPSLERLNFIEQKNPVGDIEFLVKSIRVLFDLSTDLCVQSKNKNSVGLDPRSFVEMAFENRMGL